MPKVITTPENNDENNENDEKNNENISKAINNTVFNFRDYFVYRITFGNKKSDLEIFENFRKKIINVEHLMQNYLKLNNLLKLEKRRSKTKDK